jgi:hypothetical protein
MSIQWRSMIKGERPDDCQQCLTQSKHGLIEGQYDPSDDSFNGYYWRGMIWHADLWVPLEEVEPCTPDIY